MNLKLTLVVNSIYDRVYHSNHVANFMTCYVGFGYTFPITEMPIVEEHCIETEVKYKTIFGNVKSYIKKSKVIYLKFPRELTEEEFNFWRMFKIGYLCAHTRGLHTRGL